MHFNVQNCEDFFHRGIILFPWHYIKHVNHCIKIAPSVYSFSWLDFFTEPFISLFVSLPSSLASLAPPTPPVYLRPSWFPFFFVLHIIFLFFPSHVVVVVFIFTFSLLFSGDLPQTLSIDHYNFRLSLYFFIYYFIQY